MSGLLPDATWKEIAREYRRLFQLASEDCAALEEALDAAQARQQPRLSQGTGSTANVNVSPNRAGDRLVDQPFAGDERAEE